MPMKIEDCISNWQNSLLDTTKRNRLIKFSHGRAGMFLISPELPQFWELINEDNAKMLFPWKRDLLKIRHEDVETWEDTLERSSQSTKPTAITKPDVILDNPEATQIMLIAEKGSLYEKPQPAKECEIFKNASDISLQEFFCPPSRFLRCIRARIWQQD